MLKTREEGTERLGDLCRVTQLARRRAGLGISPRLTPSQLRLRSVGWASLSRGSHGDEGARGKQGRVQL